MSRARTPLCQKLFSKGETQTIGFTYRQDEEFWLGYLDEFPDYVTQGTSLTDLEEHLTDLHKDLTAGVIPNVRRHADLEGKHMRYVDEPAVASVLRMEDLIPVMRQVMIDFSQDRIAQQNPFA